MNDLPQDWRPIAETEGEFAGWKTWRHMDPFEGGAGPFYARRAEDGKPECAMRLGRKNMNGAGAVHGGCLATFADFAAFSIADKEIAMGGVTVSLSVDYLSAAKEGALLTARGDVLKSGRSLIFVRGVIAEDDRPVAGFHAVLKKMGTDKG